MCSTYPRPPWLGMMDPVDGPHTGTLRVPGATLHYRVVGSGPPLLLIPGGDGDADTLQSVQAGLAERYTVITHDRRGLSRSPRHDPAAPVSIQTHGEDAARLLAALAGEPAVAFGTSLGGLIALEVAARHAARVRAVLAHEPPDPHLLPPDECALNIRRQLGMLEIYRREGMATAMRQFAAMVRAQEAAWESDAPRPDFSSARRANLEFFIANDLGAALRHHVDLGALSASPATIVPLVGRDSGGVWTQRAVHRLAAELGTEPIEMPGGHNGPVNQPRAFAAALREILVRLGA